VLLAAGTATVLLGAQPTLGAGDDIVLGKPIKIELPAVPPGGLHPVQKAAVKGASAQSCQDLSRKVAAERVQNPGNRADASYLCDGSLSDLAALSPAPMKTAGPTTQVVWCTTQDEGTPIVWSYRSRGEACNSRFAFTISFNTRTGFDEVAVMVYEHEIVTVTSGPIWFDDVKLTFVAYTGEFSTVEVDAATECGCVIEGDDHAWGGFLPINLGQTLTGDFGYSWLQQQSIEYIGDWIFTYEGQRPGVISIGPASEPGPDSLRCDTVVNGSVSACVFTAWTPELQVPVGVYGPAALNVAFANYYLPDGWGYLQPIARLADPNEQRANRDWVCNDGTFVRYPDFVPDDSCDEYPFAASYMSARFLGVPGADCAEIMVLFNGSTGNYDLYEVRKPLTYAERCVRGHVQLSLNEGVGGLLGSFTRTQRLLDGDYYYVYAV